MVKFVGDVGVNHEAQHSVVAEGVEAFQQKDDEELGRESEKEAGRFTDFTPVVTSAIAPAVICSAALDR